MPTSLFQTVTDSELTSLADCLRAKNHFSYPIPWARDFRKQIENIAANINLKSLIEGNCTVLDDIIISHCGIIGSSSYQLLTGNANNDIQLVSLPSCEYVGTAAFLQNAGLTYASLPKVSLLAEACFMGCSNLARVYAPEVTEISQNAFACCENLIIADYSKISELPENCFESCYSLSELSIPNVTTFGSLCFADCDSLSQVTHESVQTLETGCFYSCDNLESINFTAVSEIGDNCFNYCSNLKTVSLPNTSVLTGQSVFEGCTKIASLTIGFESFSALTFADTQKLEYVSASKLITIPSSAFKSNYSLTEFYYGSNLTSTEENTFDCCSSLSIFSCVETPNNLITLGAGTFSNCHALTSISLPEVTTLGSNCFFSAGLETVDFQKVTFVDERCFMNCFSLSSVSLPKLSNSANSVFTSCSSLSFLNLGLSSIASTTLNNMGAWSVKTLYMSNVTSLSAYTFNSSTYSGISTLRYLSFPNVTTVSNFCFATRADILDCGSFPKIVSIGNFAFAFCSYGIKSMTAPSLLSLGIAAFYGATALSQFKYGSLLTSIPADCFESCTNLTDISSIDEDKDNITYIGDFAFSNCTSLSIISMPNVTSISYSAFYNCTALEEVSFPKIVNLPSGSTSYPFRGCTSLRSLTFGVSHLYSWDFRNYASATLEYLSLSNLAFIHYQGAKNCAKLKSFYYGLYSDSSYLGIGSETFAYCNQLETFEQCDGGSSISVSLGTGGAEFYNCFALKSLHLHGSLTTGVGQIAFTSCYALSSITGLENAVFVGTRAFENCSSLTSISLPNASRLSASCFVSAGLLEASFPNVITIAANAFNNCSKLSYCSLPKATTVANPIFTNCSSLTVLNIGLSSIVTATLSSLGALNVQELYMSNVTSLSSSTFTDSSYAGISCLTYVDFPALKTVGSCCFSCRSLISCGSLPVLATVGSDAFWSCIGPTQIGTPSSALLSSIGTYAFQKASGLKAVYYGSQLSCIPTAAFGSCTQLSVISCVDSTTSLTLIQSFAFYDCPALKSASFPNLSEIQDQAFYICYSLSEFYAPKLSSIGMKAFAECSSLKSISCPEFTTLGLSAFLNCKGLEEIYFPNVSVVSQSGSYFSGCTSLKKVTWGTEHVWQDFFRKVSPSTLEEVTLVAPSGASMVEPHWQCFMGCSKLKNCYYSVTSSDQFVFLILDCFYNCYELETFGPAPGTPEAKVSLQLDNGIFRNCYKLKSIHLNEGTPGNIGSYCFDNNYSLSLITGTDAVIGIRYLAFQNCSQLASVSFPKVQYLGASAFKGCVKLSCMELPVCSTIGSDCFVGCSALEYIKIYSSNCSCWSAKPPFASCPNFKSIYVPSSYLATYQAMSCWAPYSSLFVPF